MKFAYDKHINLYQPAIKGFQFSCDKETSLDNTSSFLFFLKFLVDTCPFIWPLITFFWISGDVSKPEWAGLFTLGRGVYDVCSLRFASGVTPVQLLMDNMVASHCSPHVFQQR